MSMSRESTSLKNLAATA